jgi:hypothetical protein
MLKRGHKSNSPREESEKATSKVAQPEGPVWATSVSHRLESLTSVALGEAASGLIRDVEGTVTI